MEHVDCSFLFKVKDLVTKEEVYKCLDNKDVADCANCPRNKKSGTHD